MRYHLKGYAGAFSRREKMPFDDAVKRKLSEFRQHALNISTAPPFKSSDNYTYKVREEVIGNLASQIPEVLGVSQIIGKRSVKSIAKRYFDDIQKQRVKEESGRINNYLGSQLEALIYEVKTFLSGLSVPRKNLTTAGNSAILIRKLNRINRFSKPQARAAELVRIIDELSNIELIENDRITDFLKARSSSNKNALDLVNKLENNLRDLLRKEGRKRFDDRYLNIIPASVQKGAKKRFQNEGEKSTSEDLFSYLSFSDYVKIFLEESNWNISFSKIFPSKEWIEIKMEEIKPIRNSLAHSRGIKNDQFQRLRINCSDIEDKINKHCQKG